MVALVKLQRWNFNGWRAPGLLVLPVIPAQEVMRTRPPEPLCLHAGGRKSAVQHCVAIGWLCRVQQDTSQPSIAAVGAHMAPHAGLKAFF